MNAAIVEIAGILKLKLYHMVNTKMVFYHPKKYKELHGLTSLKCNTRQRSQGGLPVNGASNSDQAISEEASTEATSVRPGLGLKELRQKSSSVNQQDLLKVSSSKHQAASDKDQASSVKHQALKLSNQPG